MTFAQPSAPGGGDQFNAADHRGHLLIIYPKSYQPEVQTKNGPSSAADVDVVIVDKPGPDGRPLHFMNARLFGNLANSVRNDLGGKVLGRLDQINTQGGRTPWILQNFTEADAAAAGPADAAYQAGQFRQAQNPMAAAPAPAAPAQQYAPAPGAGAPAPQQQWQAPPPQQAPPQQWQQQQAPPPQEQQWAQSPTQQQWQQPVAQPSAPPASQAAATAPAPATGASAVDPNLLGYLQSKGLPSAPQDMATAVMIGKTFPDFAQAFPQYA